MFEPRFDVIIRASYTDHEAQVTIEELAEYGLFAEAIPAPLEQTQAIHDEMMEDLAEFEPVAQTG